MGLDTSHDCWHGAYSSFMGWRKKIAEAAGMPPLDKMEGFSEGLNPIKWESLPEDPALHALLDHSDCDGSLPVEILTPLADRLTELLPKIPDTGDPDWKDYFREKTQQFIQGLRLAASKNEAVEFH